MEKFISLEEFLLIKEPSDKFNPIFAANPRSIHNIHASAEWWVLYYQKAKKSWETWGDKGPLPGTKVMTLRSGHGGNSGGIRTIAEKTETYNGILYISLLRNEPIFGYDYGSRKSLVELDYYWVHIGPPEDTWKDSFYIF